MNTNNNEDLMRQEIFRISAKLDALPSVYITRNEHDPWRLSVEKRFDDINKQFDEIDRLKTEGTRWTLEERARIHNQIVETERHLQEKLDKSIDQMTNMHNKLMDKFEDKQETSTQNTWSWRQAWLIFAATTLVGGAEFIINYLLSLH